MLTPPARLLRVDVLAAHVNGAAAHAEPAPAVPVPRAELAGLQPRRWSWLGGKHALSRDGYGEHRPAELVRVPRPKEQERACTRTIRGKGSSAPLGVRVIIITVSPAPGPPLLPSTTIDENGESGVPGAGGSGSGRSGGTASASAPPLA